MAGTKTRHAKKRATKRKLTKKPKRASKLRKGGGSKSRRINQTVKTIVNTSGGGGSGGMGYQPPIINARSDPSHPQYIPQEINSVPEQTMQQRGKANPIDIGTGPALQNGIPFVGQGPSTRMGGAPVQQPTVATANPNFGQPRRVKKERRRVLIDESVLNEPLIARSHNPAPNLSEQISGKAADLNVLPSDDQLGLSRGRISDSMRMVRPRESLADAALRAESVGRKVDRSGHSHRSVGDLTTVLQQSGWRPPPGHPQPPPTHLNFDDTMNESHFV